MRKNISTKASFKSARLGRHARHLSDAVDYALQAAAAITEGDFDGADYWEAMSDLARESADACLGSEVLDIQ